MKMSDCIFCRIVAGEIPSHKLYESEKILAFLDAFPIAKGHSLVIPKEHGEKLTDISDDALSELIVVTKKVAEALDVEHYNILQNNGELAKQAIKHVHFHIIPKTDHDGLDFNWVPKQDSKNLEKLADEIKNRI